MKVSMIAAMGKNRVIGNAGKIPWHISEDFKYFKKMTLNKPIIMGRKTFESLPGILPKRSHVVISRNPEFKIDDARCSVHQYLPGVISSLQNTTVSEAENNEAFIIGGAEIYQLALDLDMVDRIYLTYIDAEYEGDAFFPEIDEDDFELVSNEEGQESTEDLRYYFRVYERRNS